MPSIACNSGNILIFLFVVPATRLQIIEKSAPVFNKKGYANTSLTDLLKATGLAKGGIYGNFRNKDEIALASLEHSLQKITELLNARIEQELKWADKLTALLNFYHNYCIYPIIEGGCPLLNTAIDTDNTKPFLKAKALQGLTDLLFTVKKLIEEGITAGEFSNQLNPLHEAEQILATIEGGIMMGRLSGDPAILNRLLENLKAQTTQRFCI